MKKVMLLLSLSAVVVGSTARFADAATCTEVSGTQLDIQLDIDEDISIRSDGAALRLGSKFCASAAVLWDINVLGSTGNESVRFNETTGTLNTYDWNVSLGGGRDGVIFIGSGIRDRYSIGSAPASHVFQFRAQQQRVAMIISFDVEEFTMRGGNGNDILRGRATTNTGVRIFTQRLNMFGQAGTDIMEGGSGADVLKGGTGNDQITGGAGSDTLQGDVGPDTMSGGDGDDVLVGGLANDIVNGNAGNDVFLCDAVLDGNDRFDGGLGDDTVSYGKRVASVTVDLALGDGGQGAETDVLIGIENAAGGSGDDLLVGNDGRNHLEGRAGDDTLQGGLGGDVIDCGDGDDTWTDPDGLASVTCENQI